MPPLQEIRNSERPPRPPKYLHDRHDTRPGPKPKPLNERPYKPSKGIRRVERSYPKERKIEVILFRIHHRIQSITPRTKLVSYRPPTFKEMEGFWKIPEQTMSDWWKNREKILQSKGGSRQPRTVWICTWPELEKNLYTEFLQKRAASSIVRRSWFRRRSKKLWKELYPDLETSLFVFSNSWFQGFCRRNSITLRCITRQVRYLLFSFQL
jgi:hypothetical protein